MCIGWKCHRPLSGVHSKCKWDLKCSVGKWVCCAVSCRHCVSLLPSFFLLLVMSKTTPSHIYLPMCRDYYLQQAFGCSPLSGELSSSQVRQIPFCIVVSYLWTSFLRERLVWHWHLHLFHTAIYFFKKSPGLFLKNLFPSVDSLVLGLSSSIPLLTWHKKSKQVRFSSVLQLHARKSFACWILGCS